MVHPAIQTRDNFFQNRQRWLKVSSIVIGMPRTIQATLKIPNLCKLSLYLKFQV